MKIKHISYLIIVLFTATLFVSCGKSKPKIKIETKPISIKTFDTPPGADPSVPPEQGGKGFTGEGWETSVNYNVPGDSNAIKGGSITMDIPDFPSTLRTEGKDANSYFNRMAQYMCHETLLGQDPVTQDYIPGLATHWKISPDHMQFWFRINPDARWADGKPVIADDIVATWKLLVDPGILEAYSNILFGTYEQPVAESKYIISVKSKQLNWRQFLYFSGMRIMPAHYVGNITGKEYLEKYQFDFIPGSGAYTILKEDINKGQSIILRRRSDYWGDKQRFNVGLNNFDVVKFEIITDESLAFERFKKGDIDVHNINRAQWWVERFNLDEVDRGLILKRKIYNENPRGVQGICFNMRKPPFDDIRLRKAIAYLWDREKFNEKLFYNEYSPIYSDYPGTVYENPNNPKIKFNLDSAKALLADAGWKDKNSDGYLVKNGKIFELDLPFDGGPGQERYLTVFQEDLKKAGIKLNLKQIDGSTRFKLGNERNFTILVTAWGGLVVPNPESSLKSNTADQPNTTNWPGIKDKRIDELCDQYNITFDKKERIKIVREIDGIASNLFGYAYGWYLPCQRIAFHNKFGYPKWMLTRTDDYLVIPTIWYIDPEKSAEYEAAKIDKSKKMEKGEVDNKYWVQVKEKEEASGNK